MKIGWVVYNVSVVVPFGDFGIFVNKCFMVFIGLRYASSWVNLSILSGFVACRTKNMVFDILVVVTLLVRIVPALVRVVFCPVCVIYVGVPFSIVIVVCFLVPCKFVGGIKCA